MSKHKQYRQWTQQEDDAIQKLVDTYGTKQWAVLAQEMHKRYGFKNRTGKQCRERWHNHLDPLIKRSTWSKEEEKIMFQQHRQHGNKWTVIAQQLPGRNDNAIKNHFYSTVRRSIRRISKIIGSKNSTNQMRNIKPSTLSKIFSIVTGNDLEYTTFPSSNISDYQAQKLTIKDNPQACKLKDYLREHCQDLAESIMAFSNYKPTKKNSTILKKSKKNKVKKINQNDQNLQEVQELDGNNEELSNFKETLEKIITINSLYEKVSAIQKRKRKEYLQSRGRDFDEDSESEELRGIEAYQNTQNFCENLRNEDHSCSHESESLSEEVIHILKKTSRRERQIKTPYFYQPIVKQKKSKEKSIVESSFIKNFIMKQENKVDLYKESATKSLIRENRIITQSPMKCLQQSFEINVHLTQEAQGDDVYPVQYQSFVISQLPELMSSLPEITFRQDSGEEIKEDFISPRFYSPRFFDPTPRSMMWQKSSFSAHGNIPGFNNDQLDYQLNALKRQFENNTQGNQRNGRSSQLAPSPKSAFKPYS